MRNYNAEKTLCWGQGGHHTVTVYFFGVPFRLFSESIIEWLRPIVLNTNYLRQEDNKNLKT